MSEKVVRIRVLAVADPSLKTAFAPLEESAKRARDRASKIVGQQPIKNQGAYRTAYQAEERAHEQSEARKRALSERNARYIERVKYASLLRDQRAAEQVERETSRTRERFARDLGGRFSRAAFGAARARIGTAADMARSAGITLDPGQLTGRYVANEKRIITATNSGMIAQGKVATEDDIKASSAAVDSAATNTKRSRGEMAEALDAFVAKSGDLESAKASLTDIGKIIDEQRKGADDQETKVIMDRAEVQNIKGEAMASNDPEKILAAVKQLEGMRQNFDTTAKDATLQHMFSSGLMSFGSLPGIIGGTTTAPGVSTVDNAGEGSRESLAAIKALEAQLQQLNAKSNRVVIENVADFQLGQGPTVDPEGRGPRPGGRY